MADTFSQSPVDVSLFHRSDRSPAYFVARLAASNSTVFEADECKVYFETRAGIEPSLAGELAFRCPGRAILTEFSHPFTRPLVRRIAIFFRLLFPPRPY